MPHTALASAQGAGPVVLVGAGQMGGALLTAWLASKLPNERLIVIDPKPSPALVAQLDHVGVVLNPAAAMPGAVVVLAIKPQMLEAAAAPLQPFVGHSTTLVSVLAGKTIADLRRAFPAAGVVVRAMPNTPAAIGQGITGVAIESHADAVQRDLVEALLDAVGQVEWLSDETLIDAVTAVSGSGPAYVFLLAECLAEAGVAAGLDPASALRLARATVEGAGALMTARPDTTPDLLRRNVTSPGGTTAAALDVLMRPDGLQPLMTAAVAAAKRRAGALSG